MTLLNTMNSQYPTRQENKADRELKELTAEVDSILSVIDDIVALNIDYTTTTPQDVQKNIASEVKQQNNKIQKLRSRILSEKMLISKSSSVFSVYQDGKKNNAMDVYSVIGSCPRVQVSELKEVADKLGFCIFNEKVFNEENNATNANIAEEAAIQLREKGYKIYYLSPYSETLILTENGRVFTSGLNLKGSLGLGSIPSTSGDSFIEITEDMLVE